MAQKRSSIRLHSSAQNRRRVTVPVTYQAVTDCGRSRVAESQSELVLSLFPGIDLLGRGFEAEGFCVVRGPDLIWGQSIETFHAPAGKFDGIIAGSPCQGFSRINRNPDREKSEAALNEFCRRVMAGDACRQRMMKRRRDSAIAENAGAVTANCVSPDVINPGPLTPADSRTSCSGDGNDYPSAQMEATTLPAV